MELLRQQVKAQDGQLSATQDELAKAKQAADAKAKAVKFLSEQKGKLWPALVAGTPLESVPYKQAGNKQVAEALEQHQANMARLRALEASSAVGHSVAAVLQRPTTGSCQVTASVGGTVRMTGSSLFRRERVPKLRASRS